MVDSTVSDSLLSSFGVWDFTTLRAAARQHLAGVVSAPIPVLDSVTGRCDPSVTTNLGEPLDPSSPCFRFFPIASVGPGSRIERGRGQGLLLADGDLELADGFDFYGVVIVAGRLTILGPGTRVTGLVLLRHSPSDTARLTGAGAVALSRCAIMRAAGRSVPSSVSARGQLESVLIWHFSRAAVGCRGLPSRGKVRKWLIFHGLPLTTRDGILVAF